MIDVESIIREHLMDSVAIDHVEILGIERESFRTVKLILPIFDADELVVARLAIGSCHNLLSLSSCAIILPSSLFHNETKSSESIVVTWSFNGKAYSSLWTRHPYAGWTKHPSHNNPMIDEWGDIILGSEVVTSGPIHEKIRKLLIKDRMIPSH